MGSCPDAFAWIIGFWMLHKVDNSKETNFYHHYEIFKSWFAANY